jgi:hypothetical protein
MLKSTCSDNAHEGEAVNMRTQITHLSEMVFSLDDILKAEVHEMNLTILEDLLLIPY